MGFLLSEVQLELQRALLGKQGLVNMALLLWLTKEQRLEDTKVCLFASLLANLWEG